MRVPKIKRLSSTQNLTAYHAIFGKGNGADSVISALPAHPIDDQLPVPVLLFLQAVQPPLLGHGRQGVVPFGFSQGGTGDEGPPAVEDVVHKLAGIPARFARRDNPSYSIFILPR